MNICIPNHTPIEIIHLFHRTSHTFPLDVTKFIFYQRGKINNEMFVKEFRILQFDNKLFQGKHEIFYENRSFWVNSLSFLKKKIFLFTDKLSFERCTFVLLQNKHIRIKNIRFLFFCPEYIKEDFHREEERLKREMYNFQQKAKRLSIPVSFEKWEKEFEEKNVPEESYAIPVEDEDCNIFFS
jgi:hypothetical protein